MANQFDKESKELSTEAITTNKNQSGNLFWDFWAPIIFTFSLYIGIRHYLAEARYIPSGSMLPGLKVQDRLLIEKISYRLRSPVRGEIVVFKSPFSFDPILKPNKSNNFIKCAFLNIPLVSQVTGLLDPVCDAYIKRVVAVAGDYFFVDNKGRLFVNDVFIKEEYVYDYCNVNAFERNNCLPIEGKVPKDHVVVLGDNRSNSWDSRFWPGGAFLPEEKIIGRAFVRFWPISRAGFLHN